MENEKKKEKLGEAVCQISRDDFKKLKRDAKKKLKDKKRDAKYLIKEVKYLYKHGSKCVVVYDKSGEKTKIICNWLDKRGIKYHIPEYILNTNDRVDIYFD